MREILASSRSSVTRSRKGGRPIIATNASRFTGRYRGSNRGVF